MKKAFLSLAVAALFSFAIVACGGQTEEQPVEGEDKEMVEEEIEEVEPAVKEWVEEVEEEVEEVIAE
jgi:hypothetical protein